MGNKVYVGNLSFDCSDTELNQKFAEFGEVTESVCIQDKFSGRCKGFGFVTYANADYAQSAIDSMNGQEFMGRTLRVNEARPPRRDNNRDNRRSY